MRVGDVGVVISAAIPIASAPADYASASTAEIILRNPNTNASSTFAATVTADASYVYVDYETAAAGDLPSGGEWRYMAHLVTPSTNKHTSAAYFNVEPTL